MERQGQLFLGSVHEVCLISVSFWSASQSRHSLMHLPVPWFTCQTLIKLRGYWKLFSAGLFLTESASQHAHLTKISTIDMSSLVAIILATMGSFPLATSMDVRTGSSSPSRYCSDGSKWFQNSLVNASLLSNYTAVFAWHSTSRHKLLRACHGGFHPCISRSLVGGKPHSSDMSIGIIFRTRFAESNVSPSIQARERVLHAKERRDVDGVDTRLSKRASAELHVHVPTETTVLRSKDDVDVDGRGRDTATECWWEVRMIGMMVAANGRRYPT
mmetsp:Transcript_9798/g.59615  ORF Transcript_9798/g.59615 Transcript_9798/m.59615 type:complete len:272 (+) Transcript_9798:3260-4075(+)